MKDVKRKYMSNFIFAVKSLVNELKNSVGLLYSTV